MPVGSGAPARAALILDMKEEDDKHEARSRLFGAYAMWNARVPATDEQLDSVHDVVARKVSDPRGLVPSADAKRAPWLEACRRNRVRDGLRSAATLAQAAAAKPTSEVRNRRSDAERIAVGRENASLIVAAILRLPSLERKALLAFEWKQKSHKQIGQLLFGSDDRPAVKAVSRLVAAARSRLRGRLLAQFGDTTREDVAAADPWTIFERLAEADRE